LLYVGHAQVGGDQDTAYLGHVLVEPKRHVPGLAELSEAEAEAIGRMVARISHVLKMIDGVVHVYAFVIGDRVDHLHIHLVPRYSGAPREYWGVRVDEWPDAPRGGPDQVAGLCERMRTNLSSD
jgi:diadenosine tetraphosphate (Ap4A) HIT family hydrolase